MRFPDTGFTLQPGEQISENRIRDRDLRKEGNAWEPDTGTPADVNEACVFTLSPELNQCCKTAKEKSPEITIQ